MDECKVIIMGFGSVGQGVANAISMKKDLIKDKTGVAVKVELLFKFENAKPRVVNAVVERIVGGQYRVTDSAILPVDLDDL